ncbi:hypothetical protein [Polyangium sp. 6x1]|uniref:hypothetical protein n=1 Tax=Polyangium sp. 6x1 TaxID=3042689 RepID=UPI002482855B|nr:hypothetical protein [Polyangium sp. 6x1]MDI1443169.1 hypothetical protein [Polyangium sp. 6x1]
MRRGISAICLLALPACVAPFGTPPVAVSVGGGVRLGAPKIKSTDPAMVHVDVGLKPLQLIREWQKRRADINLGYTFEAGAGPSRHGAFAEGTVFPVVDRSGRIGISAQPRLWYEPGTDKMGLGMAARITGELTTFVDKPFSGSSSSGAGAGIAYGEAGAGLYLEGAYAKIGERPNVTIGLGLTVRIPATAGVGIGFPR